MTHSALVSIIVVSRARPAELLRCLTGISQLYYPRFEVIVVADEAGLQAVSALSGAIKTAPFDAANISVARNIGLALAAGEIVAFIDDDAVPEPTWLNYLTEPFCEVIVAAVGGFVRARNGISFQRRARIVDSHGNSRPLEVDEDHFTIFAPTPGKAVRTEGTNMAFRRDILANLGGFDPAFRFFMNEADVNMRMSRAGFSTAVAPRAQVHHFLAAGAHQTAARVPKSLHEIGAGMRVFLRKYAAPEKAESAWHDFCSAQRNRLLSHMVSGELEPNSIRPLMRILNEGGADGRARELAPLVRVPDADVAFLACSSTEMGRAVVAGRVWNRRPLRRKAASLVRAGHVTTLFLFSPTALFHHVRFASDGYWEHSGGLFGRAERTEPLFRVRSFRARLMREQRRVALVRGLNSDVQILADKNATSAARS